MPNFERTLDSGNHNLNNLKSSLPRHINVEQVADQFLQSIDLSVHLVCAKAPPHADYADIVSALNSRWSAQRGRGILISQETLENVFSKSPVELQRCTGGALVFEAALCHEETKGLPFKRQISALRELNLGVASPASTAVVMAGVLIKATEIGNSRYAEHIRNTQYRTNAVDPVEGFTLEHHQIVIKYDPFKGIIPIQFDPNCQADSTWCSGSKTALSSAPAPQQGVFRKIFRL